MSKHTRRGTAHRGGKRVQQRKKNKLKPPTPVVLAQGEHRCSICRKVSKNGYESNDQTKFMCLDCFLA